MATTWCVELSLYSWSGSISLGQIPITLTGVVFIQSVLFALCFCPILLISYMITLGKPIYVDLMCTAS